MELPRLDGQVVLVTGANSGIGLETAVALAELGARTIITARDPAKGERAVAEIGRRSGSDAVAVVGLDLADLVSVRRCAGEVLRRYDRLDVLVANAGLVLARRTLTAQGFETTFGVNHLGHHRLVELLLPRLRASAPARVVVVSSDAHKLAYRGLAFDDLQTTRRYVGYDAYAKSKLANLLFVRELARRLDGSDVTVNAVHPGLVATNFAGEGDTRIGGAVMALVGRRVARTPAEGARTSVWAAASPELAGRSGLYLADCAEATPSGHATDDDAARRLWDASEGLLAAADPTTPPHGGMAHTRVVIVPDDYDAQRAWYRDVLGLAVAEEFADGSGILLRLAPGALLELLRPEAAPRRGPRIGIEVASAELARAAFPDDVDATPIEAHPWGHRSFTVTDPEGGRLTFFEVLPAAARGR